MTPSLGTVDERRLDDPTALQAADPGRMLLAVASSAAQIREAQSRVADSELGRLAADPRPRAVVVVGMGGSAIAGDVLSAVVGLGSPLPIIVHRGFGLPAWVGPVDVVAAVSCSGRTEETLSAAEEALRRGAQLVGVGAPDSPLAALVAAARGPYVGIDVAGRMPRASLWALSVPLLLIATHLGLVALPAAAFEAAAERLELIAQRCRPDSDSFLNPGKALALDLAGSLPIVWGTSPLGGVAAQRLAAQLAENAKYPALAGVLPEAGHNQVVTFDGPYAAGDSADFFRDRAEDDERLRLRLVLLRDLEEHPRVAGRADAVRDLAQARGIPVSAIAAEGAGPLERLASLIAVVDFASVYLALLLGIDPSPVGPIDELKARLSG
ncbi:MAG TPA: SIS domain-containing protein [Mycobacteriales bacterium]|nr:SIS domain-containing protein [Mycobacteriales bacterium]